MMNSFSNSILEVLLSWIKGIFNDLWVLLSGNTDSFFSWIGRHWVSLVCVLIITGITVDFLIYILRWKPQRVWRSKLDLLFGSDSEEDVLFSEGYENGIESFHLDSDPLISQYINPQPQLVQYDAGFIAEEAPQPADPEELPQVPPQPVVRRRRSDRHAGRSRGIRGIGLLPRLDFSSHTAYPAPPIHAREAFHDAVYPSDNTPAWPQEAESTNEQQ